MSPHFCKPGKSRDRKIDPCLQNLDFCLLWDLVHVPQTDFYFGKFALSTWEKYPSTDLVAVIQQAFTSRCNLPVLGDLWLAPSIWFKSVAKSSISSPVQGRIVRLWDTQKAVTTTSLTLDRFPLLLFLTFSPSSLRCLLPRGGKVSHLKEPQVPQEVNFL